MVKHMLVIMVTDNYLELEATGNSGSSTTEHGRAKIIRIPLCHTYQVVRFN